MDYTQVVDAVGVETGLDLKGAARTGSCTVQFDNGLDVSLDRADDGRALYMHAVLGHAGIGDSNLYAALLEQHLFGIATAGGYFGLDQRSGCLLLFKTLPIEAIGETEALGEIAAFVDQGVRWREALPGLLTGRDRRGPADAATHFPSGQYHGLR